ncbi:MAG: nicotinamide riboside transporter PnuC [Bacteroidales bacterium]
MFNEIFSWISGNYIELFGAASGLVYIILSIRQNIWLWPLGFITSAIYIYVFYLTRFYADMGLQFYYLFISIYGWIYWRKGNSKDKITSETKIARLNIKAFLVYLFINAILFVFIAYILIHYTDSDLPWWDSFTTSTSIIATYMLARKVLEHWILWIIVDSVSAGLYLYKDLYPTVVLFIIYTILAIMGFFEWKRDYKNQKK